jgi:hypothetical protein
MRHLILTSIISAIPVTGMANMVDNDMMGTVQDLQTSSECGDLSARLEKYDSMAESLQLQFYDLALNHQDLGNRSVDCNIRATIKVPAGMKFSAQSAALYGFYEIGGYGANGYARLTYEIDATNQDARWTEDFHESQYGDFALHAKIGNPKYTQCASYDQYVTLNTDVRLSAYHRDQTLSLIEVDAGDNNYQLSWDWQWQGCDLFQKPFVSYYKAYNGRNYRAIIEIDGNQGTFESDAGFTGHLYDISYHQNGEIARGRWEAKTSGGWFEFRVVNPETGQFEGEWGEGNHGHNGVGPWRGNYQ